MLEISSSSHVQYAVFTLISSTFLHLFCSSTNDQHLLLGDGLHACLRDFRLKGFCYCTSAESTHDHEDKPINFTADGYLAWRLATAGAGTPCLPILLPLQNSSSLFEQMQHYVSLLPNLYLWAFNFESIPSLNIHWYSFFVLSLISSCLIPSVTSIPKSLYKDSSTMDFIISPVDIICRRLCIFLSHH